MDDITFKLKNLEFHLRQKSIKYEDCVSSAVKMFLEANTDFDVAMVPCNDMGNELKALMKEYEKINSK